MRKTIGESDVAKMIRYTEQVVLKIVGASISDKQQRQDAKDSVSYVFGETMRTYYGIDKKN